MKLKAEKTPLPGLLLISPLAFKDRRGYLAETYQSEKYKRMGITCPFVQDNQTYSKKGVLRGLHAQLKSPQAKLVRAVTGKILDVAVDARPGSPTFGQWHGDILSGDNLKQLFIPEGFFHGFYVLSPTAVVHYKCSTIYRPGDQAGILWNDKDLAIRWGTKKPILSEKDRNNFTWEDFKKKSGFTP